MRPRSREVITPPILNRPAPTTRRTRETSAWDRLFIWVLRPGWGYRLEVLAVLLALACYQALRHRFGHAGMALAGGWVAVALVHPVIRGALASFLHARRLCRRWLHAVRHGGLVTTNDRVPRPISYRAIPAGDALVVKIPPGLSVSALSQQADLIATCLKVRAIRVTQDDNNAALAGVVVVRRDPLAIARAIPRPEASPTSLWEPIPAGLDEMGVVVSLALIERNLLVGGEPRAGKSAVLQLIVAQAALDPGVELVLVDPKSVELSPWRSCATDYVEDDLGEAIEVLGRLREEMGRRYAFLAASSQRKIEPGDGLSLIVVVIDELASYLDVERCRAKAAEEFESLLTDLVRKGAAAGIIVVAATQRPSADVIPTSLRDLFSFRWALRCSTREASDTILGSGWASRGYSASDVDPAAKGLGYLRHEGGEPVRLKAFYICDEDLSALVAKAEALRRPSEKTAPLHLVEGGGQPGEEAAS